MRNFLCSILAMVVYYPLMAAGPIQVESIASLPMAITNNAVALIDKEDGYRLVTALGLNEGKQWNNTESRAMAFDYDSNRWTELSAVPGEQGRLAASAVTVAGKVYLFGGYTVSEGGEEKSLPEVWLLDEATGNWSEYSRMPVPVDDSVVLVYQDRYIYLISGWHDVGNVNLVQVLDTRTAAWQQATPYPGIAVFGHSGGISKDQIVVCDGVGINYPTDGSSRQFLASSECWLGRIDQDNFRRINWQPLPAHPGVSRYRMASGADKDQRIWFAGGSDNPYNYDGMGYNGIASEPESQMFSYDLRKKQWTCHGHLASGTMDHRGMPWHDGWFYIIGGMRAGQQVSHSVIRFRPRPGESC
jgi:N-acetylneuraminic acid mutarotase